MLIWIVRNRTVWSFNCLYIQNAFSNHISIYMWKQDLALEDQQSLICHQTKLSQVKARHINPSRVILWQEVRGSRCKYERVMSRSHLHLCAGLGMPFPFPTTLPITNFQVNLDSWIFFCLSYYFFWLSYYNMISGYHIIW